MTCFDALNLTTETCITTIDGSRDIIEKKNIFGVGTSIKNKIIQTCCWGITFVQEFIHNSHFIY
jgi:hypothetical protein